MHQLVHMLGEPGVQGVNALRQPGGRRWGGAEKPGRTEEEEKREGGERRAGTAHAKSPKSTGILAQGYHIAKPSAFSAPFQCAGAASGARVKLSRMDSTVFSCSAQP